MGGRMGGGGGGRESAAAWRFDLVGVRCGAAHGFRGGVRSESGREEFLEAGGVEGEEERGDGNRVRGGYTVPRMLVGLGAMWTGGIEVSRANFDGTARVFRVLFDFT